MSKKKKPRRGRPKLYKQPMVVHLRMEKASWQTFRQLAKSLGISTNAAVAKAAAIGLRDLASGV